LCKKCYFAKKPQHFLQSCNSSCGHCVKNATLRRNAGIFYKVGMNVVADVQLMRDGGTNFIQTHELIATE
jgi:hypothetical protein